MHKRVKKKRTNNIASLIDPELPINFAAAVLSKLIYVERNNPSNRISEISCTMDIFPNEIATYRATIVALPIFYDSNEYVLIIEISQTIKV